MLVFSGQANVYLARERGHFWKSRPGNALMLSTIGDAILVILFATQGILMEPIGLPIILVLIGLVLAFMLVLDLVKSQLFKVLKIAG